MKFICCAILAGFLAGCASLPSDYNQGCRDGVTAFYGDSGLYEPARDKTCDALDSARTARKQMTKENRR